MIISDRLTKIGEEKYVKKILEVRGGEMTELTTEMIFDAPRCKGDTLVKAVVYDNSNLKLKGIIRIAKGAELVEAFLKQSVLLVGDGAMATAEPILEIESNEVKASHAASVGRIDEEQLFYLQSKGINREEAVKMIVQAFLEEKEL